MSSPDSPDQHADFEDTSASRCLQAKRFVPQKEGPFCPPSRQACQAPLAYLCIRITRGSSTRGCVWSFITEMRLPGAERFPSDMARHASVLEEQAVS